MKNFGKYLLNNGVLLSSFLFYTIVFWSLRILYWGSIHELPFSDMADYIAISENILNTGAFSHSAFWQSYKPPTLPLFIAILQFFFGPESLMTAWQWTVAGITYTASWFVSREIFRRSSSIFLAVFFLIAVAFSKSSIFWSYKIATEGLAEALGYLVMWVMLLGCRKKSYIGLFSLGMVMTVALLNRPQYLFTCLLIGIFIAFFDLFQNRNASEVLLGSVRKLMIIALGSALIWSPWIIRGYRLYGEMVPFSTQGPYTFLWELGDIDDDTGSVTQKTNMNKLFIEGPLHFDNDKLASTHASNVAGRWLRNHKSEYLSLFFDRLKRMLVNRDICLTKVSRASLYPGFLNKVLLDKSGFLSFLGLFGLIAMSVRFPPFSVFAFTFMGNWTLSAVFLGYPRMIEPYLPLLTWGVAGFAWLLVNTLKKQGVHILLSSAVQSLCGAIKSKYETR